MYSVAFDGLIEISKSYQHQNPTFISNSMVLIKTTKWRNIVNQHCTIQKDSIILDSYKKNHLITYVKQNYYGIDSGRAYMVRYDLVMFRPTLTKLWLLV